MQAMQTENSPEVHVGSVPLNATQWGWVGDEALVDGLQAPLTHCYWGGFVVFS